MTIMKFNERFPTERAIIDFYIESRYHGNIKCPHCGSKRLSQRSDRPRFFQCNGCNNEFSIFKGTIFEKTRTDLRKWFYAIHLITNSKKGISGCQLQREIGVTYKTAWKMLRHIRKAMSNNTFNKRFGKIVEMDETYVGGKPRKGSGKHLRGRGTKKTPVVGIIQRHNKKVFAQVALPNIYNQKLSAKQLFDILTEKVDKKSTVMTDEFRSYRSVAKGKEYVHLIVDHTKQYVNGNIHTNNMENFWSILKRGIYGVYQHCAVKYLQSYVDEFVFRFNNLDKQENMFNLLVEQSVV